MSFWKKLISLVFPATCLVCRSDLYEGDRKGLCGTCWIKLERITSLFCIRCGLPLSSGGAHCAKCRKKKAYVLKRIRSAAQYQGIIRDCLKQFKYHRKVYLVEALGELLNETVRQEPELLSCTYVAAIPMHSRKKRNQGYNHAELLARELCKRTGQAYLEARLIRKNFGPSQTELSREERILNVRGAFEVDTLEKMPKKVLLVDDVCTTGSTLEACAQTLRAAGCRQVFALTVAREL